MPAKLSFTLVADGPSDRALIPIPQWLIQNNLGPIPLESKFADLRELRHLPEPPRSFPARIALSVELFPCDLLFIHRDAENQPLEKRLHEIQNALESVPEIGASPWAGVVPIRMRETWLLIDEAALRKAAGNPDGKRELRLPPARTLEKVSDPKRVLHELLCRASGHRGRQLRKFKRGLGHHAGQIAELIEDFSLLRRLSAFQQLERDVQAVLRKM